MLKPRELMTDEEAEAMQKAMAAGREAARNYGPIHPPFAQTPADEKETVVTVDSLTRTAKAYTNDLTVLTKLIRCARKDPDHWKIARIDTVLVKGESLQCGWTFTCPENCIAFRGTRGSGKKGPGEDKDGQEAEDDAAEAGGDE